MWPSISCLLVACAGDDAQKDASSSSSSSASNTNHHEFRWCMDDSAEEQVFIPEAKRNKFIVVGLGGASLREEARLGSAILKTLPRGTIVVVSEIRARRAHIVKPIDGWASMQTEDEYVIIRPMKRETKYKVIYEDGVFVRSAAKIEDGRIVSVASFGSTLKATGKTDIIGGVERVQVEGGWVSMRLREDKGEGVPLLEALK